MERHSRRRWRAPPHPYDPLYRSSANGVHIIGHTLARVPSFTSLALLILNIVSVAIAYANRTTSIVLLFITGIGGSVWVTVLIVLYSMVYFSMGRVPAQKSPLWVLGDLWMGKVLAWTGTLMAMHFTDPSSFFSDNLESISAGDPFKLWARLLYSTVLLDTNGGYGPYIPIHLSSELYTTFGAALSYYVLLVFVAVVVELQAFRARSGFVFSRDEDLEEWEIDAPLHETVLSPVQGRKRGVPGRRPERPLA